MESKSLIIVVSCFVSLVVGCGGISPEPMSPEVMHDSYETVSANLAEEMGRMQIIIPYEMSIIQFTLYPQPDVEDYGFRAITGNENSFLLDLINLDTEEEYYLNVSTKEGYSVTEQGRMFPLSVNGVTMTEEHFEEGKGPEIGAGTWAYKISPSILLGIPVDNINEEARKLQSLYEETSSSVDETTEESSSSKTSSELIRMAADYSIQIAQIEAKVNDLEILIASVAMQHSLIEDPDNSQDYHATSIVIERRNFLAGILNYLEKQKEVFTGDPNNPEDLGILGKAKEQLDNLKREYPDIFTSTDTEDIPIHIGTNSSQTRRGLINSLNLSWYSNGSDSDPLICVGHELGEVTESLILSLNGDWTTHIHNVGKRAFRLNVEDWEKKSRNLPPEQLFQDNGRVVSGSWYLMGASNELKIFIYEEE